MTEDRSRILTNLIKIAHLILGNKVVPVYVANVNSLSPANNNLLTNALNFYSLGGGLAGILGADYRVNELKYNSIFNKRLEVTQDTQFTKKVIKEFLGCMHKHKSILMKLNSTVLHGLINSTMENVSSNRHITSHSSAIEELCNMGFNFNIKEWYCLLFSSSLDRNVPIEVHISNHKARFADVVIRREYEVTCSIKEHQCVGEAIREKVTFLVKKTAIFRSRKTATDAMKPVGCESVKGLPIVLRKVNRIIGQELFIPMNLN
jgi:hypothetical protein